MVNNPPVDLIFFAFAVPPSSTLFLFYLPYRSFILSRLNLGGDGLKSGGFRLKSRISKTSLTWLNRLEPALNIVSFWNRLKLIVMLAPPYAFGLFYFGRLFRKTRSKNLGVYDVSRHRCFNLDDGKLFRFFGAFGMPWWPFLRSKSALQLAFLSSLFFLLSSRSVRVFLS